MKALVLACCFILCAAFSRSVAAQEDICVDWQSAAQVMPRDLDFFAAVRTDPLFFEQLDTFAGYIGSILAPDLAERLTFGTLVNWFLSGSTQDDPLTVINPILGDYVAVGVSNLTSLLDTDGANDTHAQVYMIVELSPDTFIPFVTTLLQPVLPTLGFGEPTQLNQGDYTVIVSETGNRAIALSQNHLIFTINTQQSIYLPTNFTTNTQFPAALAQMPLRCYDGIIYGDAAEIRSLPSSLEISDLLSGLSFHTTTETMFGLRVNGQVLVVDAAFVGTSLAAQYPLHSDYAAWIPGDAALIVHSTSPQAFFEAIAAAIASQSRGMTPENVMEMLDSFIQDVFELGFQEQILQWSSSDFAFAAQLRSADITSRPSDGLFPIDFLAFAVIDTPEHAQTLASAIEIATHTFFEDATNIRVTPIEVAFSFNERIEIAHLNSIQIESQDTGNLNLVYGAYNDMVIFGTQDTVTTGLTRLRPVTASSAYTNLDVLVLPDANSRIFVNGDVIGEFGYIIASFLDLNPQNAISAAMGTLPLALRERRALLNEMVDGIGISTFINSAGTYQVRLVFRWS